MDDLEGTDYKEIYEDYIQKEGYAMSKESFYAFDRPNELMVMTLRAHLSIEEQMNELLAKLIDDDVSKKFSFSQKLNLLKGLHLIKPRTFKSINYFNEIRNDYSHNSNFKLTEKRINKLLDSTDETENFIRSFSDNLKLKETKYKYKFLLTLINSFIHADNLRFPETFDARSKEVIKSSLASMMENRNPK